MLQPKCGRGGLIVNTKTFTLLNRTQGDGWLATRSNQGIKHF